MPTRDDGGAEPAAGVKIADGGGRGGAGLGDGDRAGARLSLVGWACR
ncbi:hypothetical protein [Frankia sp. Cas3]|nr:hypothetical protein [Frankia sp. Cas3]